MSKIKNYFIKSLNYSIIILSKLKGKEKYCGKNLLNMIKNS